MRYFYFLIILLFFIVSCNNRNSDKYLELFGEKIKIKGNPEQQIIKHYVNGEVDYVYPLNTAISMSVILEVPAIYHCFILEQIGDEKQLSYIKIDDGMKFNYIPEYDSLEYDLNFTLIDERLGKLPSSKYDSIPILRNKSKKYNLLISTCNDSQELSDFYNNSLFFQCDTSIINKTNKEIVLDHLIEIMLVRFTENIGDENVLYYHKVYNIFYEYETLSLLDDSSKIENYFGFLENEISRYNPNEQLLQNRNYSIILGQYINKIYNNIYNRKTAIYNFYNCGLKICNYKKLYIVILKIDLQKNLLSIERNFINSNFLLPPKLIGYNHIYLRQEIGNDTTAVIVNENGNICDIILP